MRTRRSAHVSDPSRLTGPAKDAFERLEAAVARHASMVVAFSGGVDSGLLAFACYLTLGPDKMLCAIGMSPSFGGREREAALAFLDRYGIPFEPVDTHEIENEDYRKNNPDRCYHCKTELFDKIRSLAAVRGFAAVAYGSNLDDGRDYRPGAAAAEEQDVVAPLVEAELDKTAVRDLAKALGLELWDKPASPCLASRIPYFTEVTREKLVQIERAENTLADLGFKTFRVRHHGKLARIELPVEDHRRLLSPDVWETVVAQIKKAGFDFVTLDLEGFRSGRLNDVLRGK